MSGDKERDELRGNSVFLFSNQLPRLRNLERWPLAAAISRRLYLQSSLLLGTFSELPLGFCFFIRSTGVLQRVPMQTQGPCEDDPGK